MNSRHDVEQMASTTTDMKYDEGEWNPPSAAEEKALQAKRERSNQISELMGQKMLLGWTMLADSCDLCNTVMLQDREGTRLCLSCSMDDADNRSNTAAAMVAAESQPLSSGDSLGNKTTTVPPPVVRMSYSPHVSDDGHQRRVTSCGLAVNTGDTLEVLVDKVKWATDALKASHNAATNIQLCNLIKAAADAIVAVKLINLKT